MALLIDLGTNLEWSWRKQPCIILAPSRTAWLVLSKSYGTTRPSLCGSECTPRLTQKAWLPFKWRRVRSQSPTSAPSSALLNSSDLKLDSCSIAFSWRPVDRVYNTLEIQTACPWHGHRVCDSRSSTSTFHPAYRELSALATDQIAFVEQSQPDRPTSQSYGIERNDYRHHI